MIKAELLDWMGDDLAVANAARVSFDKRSDWECIDPWDDRLTLSERDANLTSYLANHNHFTPFTHCVITLRETVPIFVARQRFKHVVGFSYNEVSRRYVDDEPEFWVPDEWRLRAENKKQGSSDETIKYPLIPMEDGGMYYEELISLCRIWYNGAIAMGIAPEMARAILPQSMLTSYYVTGSLAAFARAYKLRIDDHAQKEIQDLAKQWDEIIRPLFPVSWSALVGEKNG